MSLKRPPIYERHYRRRDSHTMKLSTHYNRDQNTGILKTCFLTHEKKMLAYTYEDAIARIWGGYGA